MNPSSTTKSDFVVDFPPNDACDPGVAQRGGSEHDPGVIVVVSSTPPAPLPVTLPLPKNPAPLPHHLGGGVVIPSPG